MGRTSGNTRCITKVEKAAGEMGEKRVSIPNHAPECCICMVRASKDTRIPSCVCFPKDINSSHQEAMWFYTMHAWKCLQIPENHICLGCKLHVPPRIFFKGNTKKGVDWICPFVISPRLHYNSQVTTQLLAFLDFFSNATFYKTEENPQGHFFKIGKRALGGYLELCWWLHGLLRLCSSC